MVSGCLVVLCPNKGNIPGVTYHKLGKTRYLSWLNSIGRGDENHLSKHNVICSRHFENDCFKLVNGRTILKNDAVPTLFLPIGKKREHIDQAHEREPSPKKARMSCSSDSAGLRGSPKENRKLIKKTHTYATTIEKTEIKIGEKSNKIKSIRYKIQKQRQKYNRLRRKVTHLRQVVRELKKKKLISTDAGTVLKQSFSGVPLEVMKRMLQNVKSGKVSRQKYNPILRSFAMTLHFYSNKAYEYVRRTFNMALPSQRAIRKWFSNVHCEPGFSEPAFASLKVKVDENTSKGYSICCSLMLDEMSIKKQIDYQNGKTWGYVDLGTSIENDDIAYASEALVFMVVAVNGSWKLPIAYFLINSLNADEKANIVRDALIKLKDTGVTITSLTCDGPTVNFSMMNALGANLNLMKLQPYFLHPSNDGSKIYCIFDACHLMKLVRNNWAKLVKIFDDEGEIVDFNYIKMLHAIQEDSGLRLGNKLKSAHLDWTKQKMKVNLAVQTLSESVACALEFLMMDLKDPRFKAAGPTIRFIRLMNKVFDLLNSRNPLTVQMKMPLKESNEDIWSPVFEDAIMFCKRATLLDNTKIVNTKNKTPFKGLIITINSVIGMYNEYIKTKRLQYLMTYKFSQDHLELFFSSVRSRNGWNNNPSALQFFYTYRRLLLHQDIKNMTGNFMAQDNTSILQTPSTPNISLSDIHVMKKYDIQIVEDTIHDHDYAMPINILLTD